ncbi:unnamed protein product [Ixodes pacificus]
MKAKTRLGDAAASSRTLLPHIIVRIFRLFRKGALTPLPSTYFVELCKFEKILSFAAGQLILTLLEIRCVSLSYTGFQCNILCRVDCCYLYENTKLLSCLP